MTSFWDAQEGRRSRSGRKMRRGEAITSLDELSKYMDENPSVWVFGSAMPCAFVRNFLFCVVASQVRRGFVCRVIRPEVSGE